MGQIITIATSKGGGGKTALTVALAANLAQHGRRVLVIDADPNATLSSWHSAAYEGQEFGCVAEARHVEVVDLAQREVEANDLVLIDTAGFSNLTATCAIGTSDRVLIPCMADRGSVAEAIKTVRQTATMAKAARRTIPAQVVLTRWRARGAAEAAALEALQGAGLGIAGPALPDRVAFGRTSWSGAAVTRGPLALRFDALLRGLGLIENEAGDES